MTETFDILETKYNVAFVQDIKDRLARIEEREVQYLEVKQMIDMLYKYRGKMRAMLDMYREWKAQNEATTDEIEKVYIAYEGIFIRKQFEDAWKLYVMVNNDYHEMRRAYLANLRQTPHTKRSAAA